MEDISVKTWLAKLADRTPAPGGGAAAALFAATSASLLGMVSIYTTGDKWSDRQEQMLRLHEEAAQLSERALAVAKQDEEAFSQVGAAYGMPRATDDEKAARSVAIQSALVGAAAPPVEAGKIAQRLSAIAEDLAARGNPNVISDVAVAASGIRAAVEAAIVNIEVNAALVRDPDKQQELATFVSSLAPVMDNTEATIQRVREAIKR